ncbi:MAG TPA: oligosaccharide flippase family protein, partial [Gaiellaceae bacterium]
VSREVARSLERVQKLYRTSMTLKLASGVPILAALTGLAAVIGRGTHAIVLPVALIGLSNLVDTVALSMHSVLQGRQHMGAPALALASENVVLVSVGSIAIVVFGGGLITLGTIYVVASLVAFAVIWIASRKHGVSPQLRGSHGMDWAAARAAIPTGIASLFGAALARLDAIILSLITGSSVAVGLYGGAYRLFEATMFVCWAFGLAVLPLLSTAGRRTAKLRRLYELSCVTIGAITVPVGLVMVLFGPSLIRAVYGPGFRAGGTATRILGGAVPLYGLFTVAVVTVASQNREKWFPWLAGGALAINVALDLTLIPSLGVNGAAVAMLAAIAVGAVATFFVAQHETGHVSLTRMFAAVIVGAAAMILSGLWLEPVSLALPVSLVSFAVAFLATVSVVHRRDLSTFVAQALRRKGTEPEPAGAA